LSNKKLTILPIQADSGQMKYRSRRTHNIRGLPDVAEYVTKRPLLHNLVDDRKRHDDGGDKSVGDGQRHEKVVARLTQVTVGQYGDDDENVSGDCEENEKRQEHADEYHPDDVTIVFLRRLFLPERSSRVVRRGRGR